MDDELAHPRLIAALFIIAGIVMPLLILLTLR
jgi:hypothetical protein